MALNKFFGSRRLRAPPQGYSPWTSLQEPLGRPIRRSPMQIVGRKLMTRPNVMAAQAGRVTSSIESIAAVSVEQSAATQEVLASAEQMSAQVEEMSAQAQGLRPLRRVA